MLLIRITPKL